MILTHTSQNGSYKVYRLSHAVYVCIKDDEIIQCAYIGLYGEATESREKLIGLMARNNIGFSGFELRKPTKRVDSKFMFEAKVSGISMTNIEKLAKYQNDWNKINDFDIYAKYHLAG